MAFELFSLMVIFETSGNCFYAVTNNKYCCNLLSVHFWKRLRSSFIFSETPVSNWSTFTTSSCWSFLANNTENRSGFFPSWFRTPRFKPLCLFGRTKYFRRTLCTIRSCDIKWKQEKNTLPLWIFEVILVLKLLKWLSTTSTHSAMFADEIIFVITSTF